MSLDPNIRKTVFFVGVLVNEVFQARATAFIGHWIDGEETFAYLITAQHVIARARELGQALYVRANTKTGGVQVYALDTENFLYHPDIASEATDVAVSLMIPWAVMDAIAIPLNGPDGMACSDHDFEAQFLGLGDQTYIVGLFRFHGGEHRNLPIVRAGTLAALNEEPVRGAGNQSIQGYLIEARSIGGLSGSPVFITTPEWRVTDGARRRIAPPKHTYLLGLVHGHFDTSLPSADNLIDDEAGGVGVNTGIGIVVPAAKIIDAITQPSAALKRDEFRPTLQMLRERGRSSSAAQPENG